MFTRDFYPTPLHVIEQMLDGELLQGKTVLEPSAGKGNIVDYLKRQGASVIACENNKDLQKIVQAKCPLIAEDFLTVTSEQISHIDLIVMNPPFSAEERHILHAYKIAPAGCRIISLCNAEVKSRHRRWSQSAEQLNQLIEDFGTFEDIGDAFATAERTTNVNIGLIRIQKPGGTYESEFEGFFLEEDPTEQQSIGIMPYNLIRDLVNRYVAAVKIYDQQLQLGVQMNELTAQFYGGKIGISLTEQGVPKARADYKKDLQKSGWAYIFNKMDMQRIATKGLREDINKFVEKQSQIPFTMRNIYKMLEIVIGTTSQRMDRALLEVFDKITHHHDQNRYAVEGWKTNSHFLVTRKFILPWICYQDQRWDNGPKLKFSSGSNDASETMDDLTKALCHLTGKSYDEFTRLRNSEAMYGEWFDWGYFRCKGFKKGSMHFEFKDDRLWGQFNQAIARIKGYPLFEAKEQTAYQKRQTGRAAA